MQHTPRENHSLSNFNTHILMKEYLPFLKKNTWYYKEAMTNRVKERAQYKGTTPEGKE